MTVRAVAGSLVVWTLMMLSGAAREVADVVVYGSTPGGFCAAIAAAREGAKVILLEPTEHIGGLSTGGLSHCDSNQMVRSTLMGLFNEWHRRVVKDYTDRGLPAPYDPDRKDQSRWTFEPHVALRVTKQMLAESKVMVLTGEVLASVKKDGPRITEVITKRSTFPAKAFVDGSYEGDLMAAAGVDWTIGREGRAEFGESYAGLGLCRDEFPDTGHFPPALYVRESRRMKGMAVISQRDIIDSPAKDDPIAISSFPIDSHDCQRVALPGGGVVNEGTIFPVRVPGTGVGYAYHVPYGAILPQPEQCVNLLVPVALSCTHVGISSLRIEGAWMVIGQAAGVAAALAAKGDVAVQDLPYRAVRERLLAQGQVLDLPAGNPPQAAE